MIKTFKRITFILFIFVVSTCYVVPAFCATLFVDKQGSDNSGNGSQASPYQSVAYALQESGSGDTVSVNDGTYSENQLIVPPGVSLTSTSRNRNKVHLQPKVSLSGKNAFVSLKSPNPRSVGNQTVSHLEIDGTNGSNIARMGILVENRNNVRIHNCYIHDFNGTTDSGGVVAHSTQIEHTNKGWNYFPGDVRSAGDDAAVNAVWPTNPVENFELDHNTIARCGYRQGKDYIVPAVYPYNLKNSSIHHNTINTVGMDTECIFATSAFLWNVDIYDNDLKMDLLADRSSYIIELWHLRNGCEIYNNVANAGFSITVGKETFVHNNKIVFDKLHDRGIGIEFISQSEGSVHNNFIKNGPLYGIDVGTTHGGASIDYVTRNVVVRNNVITGTLGSGIVLVGGGQKWTTHTNTTENIHIYNNTIDRIRNSVFAGIFLHQESKMGLAIVRDVFVKNNLVMNNPSSPGTTRGTITNLQVERNIFWQNGTNQWSGPAIVKDTIVQDPLLADGYKISASSSPAYDAGVDLGYQYVGAAPDIGAMEFGAVDGGASPLKKDELNPPILSIFSAN